MTSKKTENELLSAEAARDYAKQNISHIKEVQDQFLNAWQEAQNVLLSSNAMSSETEAAELNKKALEYAKQNLTSGYDLANKLVDASDMTEAMKLQNDFIKSQLDAYTKQAKELSQLAIKTVKK